MVTRQMEKLAKEKVEAECSVDLLAACWQEMRKEEVYDSFENARKRRTQMTDSVGDADVDPSGDNEEGVEIVSPALRVGVEVGRSCQKENHLGNPHGKLS